MTICSAAASQNLTPLPHVRNPIDEEEEDEEEQEGEGEEHRSDDEEPTTSRARLRLRAGLVSAVTTLAPSSPSPSPDVDSSSSVAEEPSSVWSSESIRRAEKLRQVRHPHVLPVEGLDHFQRFGSVEVVEGASSSIWSAAVGMRREEKPSRKGETGLVRRMGRGGTSEWDRWSGTCQTGSEGTVGEGGVAGGGAVVVVGK